jgi:hypothetical protein
VSHGNSLKVEEPYHGGRMRPYRSRDDEPGEEVPDGVERRGDDRGDVGVWGYADGHHAVECEVEQREVPEEEVPEELGNRPLEPDHRVHYQPVHDILSQCVRELNDNLRVRRHVRQCPGDQEFGQPAAEKGIYMESGIYIWNPFQGEPLTCPNAYGKAEYMPAALSR